MSYAKCLGSPHVAHRARRTCLKLFAWNPFFLPYLLVKADSVCRKRYAMLRFLIYFLLRMVGPEVASSAIFRLASLRQGKIVPLMTGGTGAFGTIWIEPADAGIWLGCRVQLAIFQDFDHRTMTLLTA